MLNDRPRSQTGNHYSRK